MSISASTCITYTGTTPLGTPLYIYTDDDSFTSPIGTVNTVDIAPPNCPYIISGIPDNATQILLKDYATGCCLYLDINSEDLCQDCSLSFTQYASTTVSQIIAGDLFGACGGVTDYLVFWYGPNSSTNIGYTSGYGDDYSYQFTHPLTGDSAIFAQAGTYTPVIDKIIIDGVPYSQTGGTGYFTANLECFPSVVVDPLYCSNGNSPTEVYTHQYAFSNAAAGVTPQPLSATFVLSANTNYFAFQFQGYSVYDRLTITFSGSSYPGETFTLEDALIGSNAGGFNLTAFPRRLSTSSLVSKVLTLTGFTVNDGDFLTLQVTPNSGISQTNWTFNFTCLEDFKCESCLDNYQNNPYKILSSSVTGITQSCDRSLNRFQISGCTSTELYDEDFFNYLNGTPNSAGGVVGGETGLQTIGTQFYWVNSSCSASASFNNTCSTPNGNTITYDKGVGYLEITCSSFTDLQSFYNGYLSAYNSAWPSPPYNNTQIQYYRGFGISIPLISGATQCGDGTTWSNIPIHYSSVVTTGTTNPVTGPWTVTFSMPTITSGITYTDCELYCFQRELYVVNTLNNASTATTYNINITTNTGAKSSVSNSIALSYTNAPYTASSQYTGVLTLNDWSVGTTPWTGASTYVNSVSGITCDFTNFYHNTSSDQYVKYVYLYYISLINPSNPSDFDVYASPISNYVYSGYPSTATTELALRYSGGSIAYSNPYYVI